jgi:hypothetical protein
VPLQELQPGTVKQTVLINLALLGYWIGAPSLLITTTASKLQHSVTASRLPIQSTNESFVPVKKQHVSHYTYADDCQLGVACPREWRSNLVPGTPPNNRAIKRGTANVQRQGDKRPDAA